MSGRANVQRPAPKRERRTVSAKSAPTVPHKSASPSNGGRYDMPPAISDIPWRRGGKRQSVECRGSRDEGMPVSLSNRMTSVLFMPSVSGHPGRRAAARTGRRSRPESKGYLRNAGRFGASARSRRGPAPQDNANKKVTATETTARGRKNGRGIGGRIREKAPRKYPITAAEPDGGDGLPIPFYYKDLRQTRAGWPGISRLRGSRQGRRVEARGIAGRACGRDRGCSRPRRG